MKLAIKNMVCDRCKRVVREDLEALGLTVIQIDLGTVEIEGEPSRDVMKKVEEHLVTSGFELLEDPRKVVVEQIKTLIIDEVQYLKGNKPEYTNFSDYLAEKCGHDYSHLSQLFSTEAGQTIEQYVIAQKIEKVKELLSYGELNQNEIAWKLGYSSTAHLGNQFKKVTGMTPGAYKKSTDQPRKTLDRIG